MFTAFGKPESPRLALLKHNLRLALVAKFPHGLIWYYKRWNNFEVEINLVEHLCDRDSASVDIGAADGLYTLLCLPYSRRVYAFEPRPDSYRYLKRLFAPHCDKVRIENIALSDDAGRRFLRCPVTDTVRSTLDEDNPLLQTDTVSRIEVTAAKLDDIVRERVGFIKIDVEGHERSVVQGASKIIDRYRPNLLIEAEERHHPGTIRWLFDKMLDLGYVSMFFERGVLRQGKDFDPAVHQRLSNIIGAEDRRDYVNNFVFLSDEGLARRLRVKFGNSEGC